jgi:DNA primase large subunit
MRRRKVEEVAEAIRELDEESLKELFELIKKELEPEAEVEPEAIRERPQEAVVQEVTPMPTPVQEAPTITLEVLAKYPLLEEVRQFYEAFSIDDLEKFAEAIKTRVLEALERGEKGILPRKDPMEDLLSFIGAKVVCLAIGKPWLVRRWALAEATRMERYLHTEEENLRRTVLTSLLNIEEADQATLEKIGNEYRYRIRFTDYLQFAKELKGPEWRLVNRMLVKGYVYLTVAETIRLLRARAYQRLSSTTTKITTRQLPPRLQEVAEDVVKELVKSRAVYEELLEAPKPGDWPPCMEAIRMRIADASHRELFSFAAFLINRGYSTEQILTILSERPDFNERIARYQVEHIAGLRGSRTKYKPPSCQTMKAYGLCIEDGRLCPKGIRNPLDFKPKDRQKGVQKHEQTTQTPP